MKKHLTWSYAPYKPLFFNAGDIYICRIVPYAAAVHFEWLETESGGRYEIYYRERAKGDFARAGETECCSFDIEGLKPETDYEFYVCCGSAKSRIRLARTGECFFGSVVNYLHPEDGAYSFSGRYLCSPSFARMPDGALVASMDVYAAQHPQNLTLVYRSEDEGRTWQYACELSPCFWGQLFVHRGELYMLACSTEYGDLLIGKSTDGGRSFGEPVVLLRGSNGKNGEAGCHKAPQPVVEYGGRIWNTLEWGSWRRDYFAAMVCSASVDSDLLRAESWSFSEPLPYSPAWEGVEDVKGYTVGGLEGCPVVGPDGKLYNVMRYEMKSAEPDFGRVLVHLVDTQDPEASHRYQRAMEFPANNSKFEIRYDERSGCWYSLANRILDSGNARSRNLLSLMRSRDFCKWETVLDVIDRRDRNPGMEGFQYVAFDIWGDDILYLCRTAINGAHSFHDSNYIVFDRIENFRDL